MLIRVKNDTEQIRNYLDDTIDNMCRGLSEEKQDEIIESYFNELKEKNYSFYEQLIGMMFADHYKLIKLSEKYKDMDDEDKLFLDLYDDFHDIDDILNYMEEYPEAIFSFVYNMSEFNSYSYFEKREAWLACKDDLPPLMNMSPLNNLDYLYYCQKYSVETFRTIYDYYTSVDKSLIGSFKIISSTLNELGIVDEDNYYEVASDLLTLYYVIAIDEVISTKDNGKKGKLKRIIKKLENEDYGEILLNMNDDKFLSEIFMLVFDNENRELTQQCANDDIYNDTVKKLTHIKDYFK